MVEKKIGYCALLFLSWCRFSLNFSLRVSAFEVGSSAERRPELTFVLFQAFALSCSRGFFNSLRFLKRISGLCSLCNSRSLLLACH